MKKYLLDTNICIFFIKGQFELDIKIEKVGSHNCFISEITIAELKFGVENSKTPEKMRPIVEDFISKFAIIPIFNSLGIYAKEKARLRKNGIIIDDFDILIGSSAVVNEFVMVTNNVNHLGRLENIEIEDWATLNNK